MDWMLLPYRRYAEFSGRSRRREYWMFALLLTVVYSACIGLMFAGGFSSLYLTGGEPTFGITFWIGAALLSVFGLASLVPSVAVGVRRLHDRDMSGWWYLGFVAGGMVPYVGWLISLAFLVIMCLDGTRGPNRFGPDPKDRVDAQVFN